MTPNSRHHIPRAETPAPRPVAELTRVELAARIAVLRVALDGLWLQVERDGAEPYRMIGAGKTELIALEEQLRQMDRAAGHTLAPAWHSAALASPTAADRLRAAQLNAQECERGLNLAEHVELAGLVRAIAVAGAVSLAGGAK